MDLGSPLSQVVQKQATIGDILEDYTKGLHASAIAEKYGLDAAKVQQVIFQANQEGKFIPDDVTPEPEASDQAIANVKARSGKMTTKENV